jgi:hypothetical protein
MVRASHIVEEGKAAMKMQGRFGLATAVLLVIPTFSQAQRAAGNFRAATSAPVSAPIVHNTAVRAHSGNRPGSGHAVKPASAAHSADSSLGASNFGPLGLGIDPLSSFGLDFEHAIAIRDAQLKAFIDPATQQRLALADRRARRKPKTTSGFIFLDGGGAYVLPAEPGTDLNPDADGQTAQDQGQDQEQVAPQERAQHVSKQQEQLEANNARLAQEQSESLPDEGEFTLILRNGQEIEAVAFTRVDDRIVYITIGGGRHTVAVRELDVDATVRLNQERGTPLQIPL